MVVNFEKRFRADPFRAAGCVEGCPWRWWWMVVVVVVSHQLKLTPTLPLCNFPALGTLVPKP